MRIEGTGLSLSAAPSLAKSENRVLLRRPLMIDIMPSRLACPCLSPCMLLPALSHPCPCSLRKITIHSRLHPSASYSHCAHPHHFSSRSAVHESPPSAPHSVPHQYWRRHMVNREGSGLRHRFSHSSRQKPDNFYLRRPAEK